MMMILSPKLMKSEAFINGEWVSGSHSYQVLNPANGSLIASVADCGEAEIEAAIAAAHAAFPAWKGLLAKERAQILRRWFDLIVENADDLAAILTAEQGKPLAEARGEIMYGASFIEFYGEEAKRIYGDLIPSHKKDARIMVTREPVGVVGAITPWNFPNAMITRKVGPALAAGCTVVLKPSEETPFSALALAALAEQAGVPAGVLNITPTTNARKVGDILTSDERVRKITFTGSTGVGKSLMAQGASLLQKMSLELGGNAPFIVFEGADLDKAADGAMICKFRNAGQTCVCANRILVQNSVLPAFQEKLLQRIKALKVGDGSQDGVQIGPLINEKAIEKVAHQVKDAVDQGATLICGGKKQEGSGTFFEPTLLVGMTKEMLMQSEETFGPVAGLFAFKDEDEAIKLANDTRYGLASYFYTNELGQALRVAEALQYGMVAINEPILSTELAPFGGIKESGIGREGSKYGIEDYLEMKYILLGGLT
jgi:succinate-semialdehyde dehydrogenase/glutarate-semialdehyde dehydrogenase